MSAAPRTVIVVLALLALAAMASSATAGSRLEAPSGTTAAKKRKKAAKKRCTPAKRKTSKRRTTTRRPARARRASAAATKRKAAKRRTCRKPRPKKKRKPARPIAVVPPAPVPFPDGGAAEATVIAILDFGLNPYHWDFLASKMPQNGDSDPANDVPLDKPANEWLAGFPAPAAFNSFSRVDLTLDPADPETTNDSLRTADEAKWKEVKPSTVEERHVVWFPGTKVIGAMTYLDDAQLVGADGDHGVGTTSSSVGNLHGTCPECLLFFIQLGETPEEIEAAIEWAESQPWIDAISNSYGLSLTPVDRTRVYDGSDTEAQRVASERGQTVFFSAGNGNDGAFVTPNNTTFSSQEGPDWIVTVGAVSPPEDGYYDPMIEGSDSDQESGSYTGAGKPADIAGVGSAYPTAYTATTVGGTGASGFGGTSNATPSVAGLYGRTLHTARRLLVGPSRTQSAGVVATGEPFACGVSRPACELADGRLTAAELRARLFLGAKHSASGSTVYNPGTGDGTTLPQVGEEEFMGEGHGAYLGRVSKDRSAWLEEFKRLESPLTGAGKALVRPPGELEWMIVDSYCRQRNWGAWPGGYYLEGVTQLPGPDPAWPVRSQREQTCPGGPTPP